MNETLETIKSLRSIHGTFSDRQVSEEDLAAILDAAVRAANASARQSYSIVVVDDPETMSKLTGYKAARMLLFCVDFNRVADTASEMGHPYSHHGIVGFLLGTIDASLAAQTAAIASRSMGIDSLFTNGIHRADLGVIYETLDLPRQGCFPLVALMLGYRAVDPGPQHGRLCGTGVVHRGQYRRMTAQEVADLVAQYDDPKLNLGRISDWSEQGFEHYLDWFYTKWAIHTPPAGPIIGALEEAGFLTAE